MLKCVSLNEHEISFNINIKSTLKITHIVSKDNGHQSFHHPSRVIHTLRHLIGVDSWFAFVIQI